MRGLRQLSSTTHPLFTCRFTPDNGRCDLEKNCFYCFFFINAREEYRVDICKTIFVHNTASINNILSTENK